MPALPTQKPFDLVMFDLDGTLIETAPEICDAVNDTLQALGLRVVSQTQVNDWIGHGTRTLLVQALAWSQGLSEAQVRAADSLAGAASCLTSTTSRAAAPAASSTHRCARLWWHCAAGA